jgi:hypothetical protein
LPELGCWVSPVNQFTKHCVHIANATRGSARAASVALFIAIASATNKLCETERSSEGAQ